MFFSPWRIVDDCGGAFTMGAIGGGVFQSVKGFRNAPVVSFTVTNKTNELIYYYHTNTHSYSVTTNKHTLLLQGVRHRLRGSVNAVRVRAPQIGGDVADSFLVFVYRVVENCVVYV